VSTADVLPQGSRRSADFLGIVYFSIQIYIKNDIVKSEIFTVRSYFRSQILKNIHFHTNCLVSGKVYTICNYSTGYKCGSLWTVL